MIYDCFTFFNELDLLELRLHELDDVVDKFVLVEATKTHQKKDKPLYFELNKNRFQKFDNKIIHIVVDEYPNSSVRETSNWDYERNQRNAIGRGLKNCKADDIILISDVDEIPNPSKIVEYKGKAGIKLFRQKMFYYFFNCINASDVSGKNYNWVGTVMIFYKDFSKAQHFRDIAIKYTPGNVMNWKARLYYLIKSLENKHLNRKDITFIDNGGWHFSYLGGVEKIISKIESFAHAEYNKEEYKDPEKLLAAINSGEDIFGRDFKYKFVNLDDTFPQYLTNNREKFNKFIKN